MTGRPIGEKSRAYDSSEFQVTTATTNYDVAANQSSWLENIKKYNSGECGALYIVTDQEITVRFNAATAPAITVTSSESPARFDDLVISNVFITNTSGSTAKIKLRQFII